MKRINMSGVATGMAATALFIAVGGPAQAASLISGKDIRNNSVTGIDVRNNSLTGADVRNNSLTGADVRNLKKGDFAAGQLPAGATGATGATGAKGDRGDIGPEGPSRWVLVNRAGAIEAQSGGFRIANAYPAGGAGEGNVYIDSGDANLANNGIVATIALENQYTLKGAGGPAVDNNVDGSRINGRNTGADANPEFSGEITATKCNIPTVVVCAPPDTAANGGDGVSTDRPRYFVVSPRLSNGGLTVNDSAPGAGDNTHKRFYVILSGPRD